MKSLTTESILTLLNPDQQKDLLKNLILKHQIYAVISHDCEKVSVDDYIPSTEGLFLSEEEAGEGLWNILIKDWSRGVKDGKIEQCFCGEYREYDEEADFWDKQTFIKHFKDSEHFCFMCTIFRLEKI